MFRPILSSLLLILSLSAAHAQDVTGTITGTLDGEDRVWFTTALGDKSQSDWTDMGPLFDVSIWGHATDDSISSNAEGLTMDFKMMGSDIFADTIMLVYYDSNVVGNYYASHSEDVTISLTQVDNDADILQLEGHFSARLYYSEDYSMTQDPEDSKTAEGVFTVTLTPRP